MNFLYGGSFSGFCTTIKGSIPTISRIKKINKMSGGHGTNFYLFIYTISRVILTFWKTYEDGLKAREEKQEAKEEGK